MEIMGGSVMSEVNEFNAETGQVVIRTYNQEELSQREIDLSDVVKSNLTPLSQNETVISAIEKLQSLGLTIDEAKAIIGIS
jgi:hypothetical protein